MARGSAKAIRMPFQCPFQLLFTTAGIRHHFHVIPIPYQHSDVFVIVHHLPAIRFARNFAGLFDTLGRTFTPIFEPFRLSVVVYRHFSDFTILP